MNNVVSLWDSVLLVRVGVDVRFLSELKTALASLPDNQWKVIASRFGQLDGGFRSMSQAQKFLGISRQRVEQIEKRAVEMLRDELKSRGVSLVKIGRVRINKYNIKYGNTVFEREQ